MRSGNCLLLEMSILIMTIDSLDVVCPFFCSSARTCAHVDLHPVGAICIEVNHYAWSCSRLASHDIGANLADNHGRHLLLLLYK